MRISKELKLQVGEEYRQSPKSKVSVNSTNWRPVHPACWVNYRSYRFPVDRKIYYMLKALWLVGFRTNNSCQDGYVSLLIPTQLDLVVLENIIRKYIKKPLVWDLCHRQGQGQLIARWDKDTIKAYRQYGEIGTNYFKLK